MAVERATPHGDEWESIGAQHLARYIFAGAYTNGKRVLDAGCGDGYGSFLLKTAGAREVTGVDLDAATVAKATRNYPSPDVHFVVDDCQELAKVRGAFDVVTNFENIEHLPAPEKFLTTVTRLLTPQGVALISTPDRASTPPFVNGKPANPFHVHEWYSDEFQALLNNYFASVEIQIQVETTAVRYRRQAMQAVRQAMAWADPVSIFLYRKLARTGARRSWKVMEDLAAGGPGDFPIIPAPLAGIFGKPCILVAICREPRKVETT